MIPRLSTAAVIQINRGLVGNLGVRDEGLLDSALGQPHATWGGMDLYASVYEKLAVLIRGISGNHAFVDGNKRTAWLAGLVSMAPAGLTVADMAPEEAGQFVLDIAEGIMSTKDAALWLMNHCVEWK